MDTYQKFQSLAPLSFLKHQKQNSLMISDDSTSQIISSMDPDWSGKLWVFDAQSGLVKWVRISITSDFRLFNANRGRFIVQHGSNGGTHCALTAHNFTNPETIVAECRIRGNVARFSGDSGVWRHAPTVYKWMQANHEILGILEFDGQPNMRIQEVDFKDQVRDGEGISDLVMTGDTRTVAITFNRSSTLLLYDWKEQVATRKISLGNRAGNPVIALTRDTSRIWTCDYDTIVLVDTRSWKVMNRRLVQPAFGGFDQLFVGSFSLCEDLGVCIVARPFMNDVIGLDLASLENVALAPLHGQPIEAVVLRDGRIVAREWKSGRLLTGTLAMPA